MKKILSFLISCSIIFNNSGKYNYVYAILNKEDLINPSPIERFINKIKILKSFHSNEKETEFLNFFEDHTIPLISIAENANSIVNDEYSKNENVFLDKKAIITDASAVVRAIHDIISDSIAKMTSDINHLHDLKNMSKRYLYKNPTIPSTQITYFHKQLEQYTYVLNSCFQKLVKAFDGYESENDFNGKNEKLNELEIFAEFIEIYEHKIHKSYKEFSNLRANYLTSEEKIDLIRDSLRKESAYAELVPLMIQEYGKILSSLVSDAQKESEKYKNMKDELENLFDGDNEILAHEIQIHFTRFELLIDISYILESNILKSQKFINSFLTYLNQQIVVSTNSYAEKVSDEGVHSAIIAATNFIGIFFNMRRKCKEIIIEYSETDSSSKILLFAINLNNALEGIIKEFISKTDNLPVLGFCFDELLKTMISYFNNKTDKESFSILNRIIQSLDLVE